MNTRRTRSYRRSPECSHDVARHDSVRRPHAGTATSSGVARRGTQRSGGRRVRIGADGLGETAPAKLSNSYCFTFLDAAVARAELRRLIQKSAARHDRRHLVLVIDDVYHLTPQRRTRWRELTRNGVQMVTIVERSLATEGVAIIRAALGSAPLLSLGPLSLAAAERYFVECSKAFGLRWNASEVRGTARSTGGVPLTMRMTVDAAIRRARARSLAE